MTESTPYNPCSKKGGIRASIATKLMDEVKAGSIRALIARAADFYGPYAEKVGIPNALIFNRVADGKKPNLLAKDSTKHSYTFTLDIASALGKLARSDKAFGQVWHLPTAPDPLTGKDFVALAAKEFGARPGYLVLSKWMLIAAGMFDRTVYEIAEMYYQNEFDYVFDSTKIQDAFGISPTPYSDGVGKTAEYYRKSRRQEKTKK